MIKKPSPLTQMTIALVLLCTMLVIMADLFFGVLHAGEEKDRLAQRQIGESISLQIVSMLRDTERIKLRGTLESIASNSDVVKTIGIRSAQDEILISAGNHRQIWQMSSADDMPSNQMVVKLDSSGQSWGQVEFVFYGRTLPFGLSILSDPMVITLLFLMLLGGPAFWLYMRRALQYLDPASVIPERVQAAFDAMSEGVVIVDKNGRILLASRMFRELSPDNELVKTGSTLSSLSWLAPGLPTEMGEHPWIKAIRDDEAQVGQTIVLSTEADTRHLVIGCSPIHADDDAVRGCLVTFSDTSDLYKANATLTQANQDLSESKKVIQEQNEELQRLATRDPLTGCLNRRALFDSLDTLVPTAQENGEPVSCLILDIDNFKSVNDTFGHGVGDLVIQQVAKPLKDLTRSTDLVTRYGGEEFCVFLPQMSAVDAFVLAERIRLQIQERVSGAVEELDGRPITVSIGVDGAIGRDINVEVMIDQADQSLYDAKKSGRNRVCAFWERDELTSNAESTDEVIHGS